VLQVGARLSKPDNFVGYRGRAMQFSGACQLSTVMLKPCVKDNQKCQLDKLDAGYKGRQTRIDGQGVGWGNSLALANTVPISIPLFNSFREKRQQPKRLHARAREGRGRAKSLAVHSGKPTGFIQSNAKPVCFGVRWRQWLKSGYQRQTGGTDGGPKLH